LTDREDAGQSAVSLMSRESAGRHGCGLLIAADRGLEALRQARELCGESALPDVAVGDFDSVSAGTLAFFEGLGGIRFERHRPEKNQSDTELALAVAAESGAEDVLLMGVTGTRLDHMLSNVLLLKEGRDMGLRCTLLDAHNRLRLLAGRTVFRREDSPYSYISFLPLTARVEGITLRGFRYPLEGYSMELGAECGLCVSNEIRDREAVVDFSGGLLLAIESKD